MDQLLHNEKETKYLWFIAYNLFIFCITPIFRRQRNSMTRQRKLRLVRLKPLKMSLLEISLRDTRLYANLVLTLFIVHYIEEKGYFNELNILKKQLTQVDISV